MTFSVGSCLKRCGMIKSPLQIRLSPLKIVWGRTLPSTSVFWNADDHQSVMWYPVTNVGRCYLQGIPLMASNEENCESGEHELSIENICAFSQNNFLSFLQIIPTLIFFLNFLIFRQIFHIFSSVFLISFGYFSNFQAQVTYLRTFKHFSCFRSMNKFSRRHHISLPQISSCSFTLYRPWICFDR